MTKLQKKDRIGLNWFQTIFFNHLFFIKRFILLFFGGRMPICHKILNGINIEKY